MPDFFAWLWTQITPHVSGGSLGIIITIVLCAKWVIHSLKPVVSWAKVHLDEHDLMWEEYCRNKGIDWRVTRPVGRGTYLKAKAE